MFNLLKRSFYETIIIFIFLGSTCLFIKYIVPHIKNLYMVCMNNYPVLTVVVSLFLVVWVVLFFLIGLVYDV